MSASLLNAAASPLVVVADDDDAMRTYLATVLDGADFQMLAACNASDAFELLQTRNDIDALLTDVDMPGVMDGLALAKLARNCWPHLAIIVMSGRPLPLGYPLPERATFQPKPFDSFALLTRLRAQISVARSLRSEP